jgi:hypothetical protein
MSESELFKQFEEDGYSRTKQRTEDSPERGDTIRTRSTGGEEAEFRIELVKCEICREIIGKCDMSKFESPMHGALFISKDHKHGYPAPFYALDDEWLELRCPICRKRPFLTKNYFMNEKDIPCGNVWVCEECNQGFAKKEALWGHKSTAHRREK